MSTQQVGDAANAAKIKILEWRMAILWFGFFTVVSLSASILASLQNTNYTGLDGQGKFMMVLAILISWGNTMMAFFSKAAKKVDQQINGDTQFITRVHAETDSVKVQTASSPSNVNIISPAPQMAGGLEKPAS